MINGGPTPQWLSWGEKIVVFQSLPNMIQAIRFTQGKLYCRNGSRWSARADPMFFEVPLIKYKKLIIQARAACYLLRSFCSYVQIELEVAILPGVSGCTSPS
jgi:hypothetical protein